MVKTKRILSLFLLIAIIVGIFTGCAGTDTSADDTKTLADFKTAKIGIMTGSSHDGTAKEIFPEAERVYFNTVADMVLATEQGKIDGYIEDAPFLASVLWEGANIKRLEEPIKQVNNGFAFPQSEESRELRQQVNSFIAASKADGTMDALIEKWLSDTEPTEHPDYTSLRGENGTIRLAVTVENKPAVYLKDNLCTGFEIEFLTRFAQQYGYNFEIEAVPFGSVIAGIAAGKYDMAAASLNITPEREESVDFSDPYALFDVAMVVKGDRTMQAAMTLADLENATIGVITGSAHNGLLEKHFPNAKRVNFTVMADMMLAVQQGKIDCYIEDEPFMAPLLWEGVAVKSLDEAVAQISNGFVFPQSEESSELRQQVNTFLAEAKADGTVERLVQKWLGDTEPTEHPAYSQLTGENGTIHLAISVDNKPLLYQNAEGYTGLEMELLTLFGQYAGYSFDIDVVPFESIIAGISSGKYDMGASTLTITPEREESVDFSDPYASFDVVMVVGNTGGQTAENTQPGFWDELKEDFQKTFVRENRWKLIVKGIGVTMLISICAAITGTLLGFGLYMLSRADAKALQRLATGVAKVYSRIIAGTPIVVILMILFYVIFGNIRDMNGIVVAIIGFTLTFGAFVYDHMTVSVSSVDSGQTEAAYALGYTKNKTFFRIIFPQAMTVFLPSYCGQAVELIKATAVVGYVAVNDLTKMGDIIRSNTYEAFFPLIATAVIYFLLTWMLSALLGLVKRHFEPKRRSKEDILKGVKTV